MHPKSALILFLCVAHAVPCYAATRDDGLQWVHHYVESTDGTRIAYYVAGTEHAERTPLLVISGGPGSDHRYMRVGGSFDRLSKSRMVVMFDQRGTSLSGELSSSPRMTHWVEDVEAIRRSLSADQMDVLGHSFGGLVAMAYAREHIDRLRSLVFVDSAAPVLRDSEQLLQQIYPDRIQEWQTIRQSLPTRFRAQEIELFFSMEFVDPELTSIYLDAVAEYVYNIDINNSLRSELSNVDYTSVVWEIRQPVLIVHGRFDAVIAPATSWALHKLISSSEIIFIEESGHLPFVEKPDEFADTVSRFLDSIENRGELPEQVSNGQ